MSRLGEEIGHKASYNERSCRCTQEEKVKSSVRWNSLGLLRDGGYLSGEGAPYSHGE